MTSQPISILVAEDDPDDLFFLQRVLAKAAPEAQVTSFPDGETAQDHLKQVLETTGRCPSLAILDIRMPGRTGLELLQWIRAQRHLDRMAVVMLTSSVAVEDIATAVEFRAQCYSSKHLREQDVRPLLAAAEAFSAGTIRKFDLPINLLR